MTHNELVEVASKWLATSAVVPIGDGMRPTRYKCPLVLTEIATPSRETPDAIGFYGSGLRTVLVECKRSRSDFLADAKKSFRRKPKLGVGDYRYFLAPSGLLKASEIPELWGLIECDDDCRVSVKKVAGWHNEKNRQSETHILYSTIRRLLTGSEEEMKPLRLTAAQKRRVCGMAIELTPSNQ